MNLQAVAPNAVARTAMATANPRRIVGILDAHADRTGACSNRLSLVPKRMVVVVVVVMVRAARCPAERGGEDGEGHNQDAPDLRHRRRNGLRLDSSLLHSPIPFGPKCLSFFAQASYGTSPFS